MPFDPAIETHGLTVDLGGARRLDNVSIAVKTGSFHGLLGPNGAGKSTLLRVLYRAQVPNSGEVSIGGRALTSFLRGDWVNMLGALVQEGGSMQGLSVRDVVEIGLMGLSLAEDERERRIMAAIQTAGLEPLADAQAALISGGERQKTFIAQLLARDPQIYLLDEPANHLDLQYQFLLLDEIRDRKRTVLATFHDISLAARYCDTVTVLHRGKVFATGAPHQVLTPQLFSDVFGINAHFEEGRVHVLGART